MQELAEESQRYLNDVGDSKRVQWKPNARQIRYYSTLGVLDKPDTENGRTVWYGPRHLLQLLAIKRLQLDGWKLADIQLSLAGATVDELLQLGGLPPNFLDELRDSVTKPAAPRRETAFWTARPPLPDRPRPTDDPCFEPCWRLEIEPGVSLILQRPQAQILDDEERAELARELKETWHRLKEKRSKEKP